MLKVTSHVATPGAESAVYDCLVVFAAMLRRKSSSARPRPFVRSAGAITQRPARSRSRARSWTAAVGGRLAAAGRSVCRKYRKASIRRLQQQEYDKLCRIVPALATRRHRRRIAKVTITTADLENILYTYTIDRCR